MNLTQRLNQKRRPIYTPPDSRGWSLAKSTCPACGKRCYATRADARRAGRQIGGRHRAYQCGPMWHVTSQDAATVTRHRDRR